MSRRWLRFLLLGAGRVMGEAFGDEVVVQDREHRPSPNPLPEGEG